MDRVTDIKGTAYDLVGCKRCGREFIFKLDEKGEAVSGLMGSGSRLDS
jgi:hypothetical protein